MSLVTVAVTLLSALLTLDKTAGAKRALPDLMLRGQANNAKRGRGMRPGIALPRGGKKAATSRNKASRLGVNTGY